MPTNPRHTAILIAVAMFAAHPLHGQILSLESGLLRDDIPADIQQHRLALNYPLSGELISQSSYRYLFADQNPFSGLERLRVALHTVEQAFRARWLATGLQLHISGALTLLPTDAIVGDFRLGAAYDIPVSVSAGDPPILFTLKADAGRSRDQSVTTALVENISVRDAAGQLDISLMEVLDISARAQRSWYSDGNRKESAYAYLLANVFADPKITLGYAWSWTDTERSNWSATGTSFNPSTREYRFEYFYYPYFTPLMERGHLAIAILQWYLFDEVLLHGKATVPVYSRGRLKYMPEAGRSPVPIDFDVTYEIEDILPTQYEVGLITEVFDPVVVSVFAEYFSKPYYSYTAGRLGLQYRFDSK
ncbi:MAG: hypothetical protein M5R41_07380 [Bacteroidia bacterium]|nr:hypothetical protein [Bacteroidia bacterium]